VSSEELSDASWLVLQAICRADSHYFIFIERDIGGTSCGLHGTPLTDETIEVCKKADAILLGAIGGPKWDNLPVEDRPEAGLLKIRKALNLYANIRPIKGFAPLLHASPLKEEVIE